MCLCSFKLPPFLPQWASSSENAELRKLAPVKSSRPRRKVRQRHAKRAWCDSLIYSNLVYLLAALISFGCEQNFCGMLQLGASIASTMFHRSAETKYLLLDALISGTLGVIFVFAGQHTLSNEWYGILTIKLLLGILLRHAGRRALRQVAQALALHLGRDHDLHYALPDHVHARVRPAHARAHSGFGSCPKHVYLKGAGECPPTAAIEALHGGVHPIDRDIIKRGSRAEGGGRAT
jgi:hypothetical protein